MKTNEVERLTGLNKQTIRYYEKEGLIVPVRDENEYRNYSNEDIQVLQLIKLLRSMSISIDDIKLTINGQLTLQECLCTQSAFIENSIDELNSVRNTIKKYKDKQLPIIPALRDIDSALFSISRLGFQKTTKTVTIGRRFTRKLLIRTLIVQFLVALMLGYIGLSFANIYTGIIIVIIIFIFQFFVLAKGWGNLGFGGLVTGTSAYQNNPIYFVEFIETGIRYYARGSILKQLRYFKSILLNKDGLTYYPYEDIDTVIVESKLRYVGATGLAIETTTYDFTFIFNDGTKYYLYNPITLNNDLKYIAHILKDKVGNIVDKNNALENILTMHK